MKWFDADPIGILHPNHTPAPIMGDQLPNVRIELVALMKYAHEEGVKADMKN